MDYSISPTGQPRRLDDFFFDAFCIVSIKNSISQWSIHLCNRDVRTNKGFTCQKPYNLLTGLLEGEQPPVACPEEINLKQQIQQTQDEIDQLKKNN